jgi:hypothetical protein
VNAFYDSGCNLTTVTNSQQSDSNAIITRNPCKDCHYVIDAIGTETKVNDFAFLFNHKANVVNKFIRPLLSVSQVNLSNNAFSLFTSDKCYAIKWNRKLQSYVSKILQHASSSNLMVVQGIQCNGMYEIPISDCLNKSDKPFIDSDVSFFPTSKTKSDLMNDLKLIRMSIDC